MFMEQEENMFHNALLSCLRCVLELPLRLKRSYKFSKFSRCACIGENLMITAKSNCDAEKRGLIQIGDNCEICGRLESQGEGRITIGDNTGVYNDSVIGSVNSIEIGSCVLISNHVHIYDNNNHPISPKLRREICMNGFRGEIRRWTMSESKPIVIEDNVWVGEYAAIMKGVTVGRGSIVAAHAVVTKDVPPYTIAAGNPARVVKTIENDEE